MFYRYIRLVSIDKLINIFEELGVFSSFVILISNSKRNPHEQALKITRYVIESEVTYVG